MRSVFLDQTQSYIERLCAVMKPQLVAPCMIYFPSVDGHGWSDALLAHLRYGPGGDPAQLQEMIRMGYRNFTCHIKLEGTRVVPIPLFEFLDPNDVHDYENRVEPSVVGSAKIARELMRRLFAEPPPK